MLAATHTVGGPAREVLDVREVLAPDPGPGEVRVAVHYSGINPTDVRSRADAKPLTDGSFRIPHQDGAGTVDRVGQGVDASLVGREVWVFHAAHGRLHGTAAEYVCLPVEQVVVLPDGVGPLVGATLGVPALTAHLCAFEGPASQWAGGRPRTALVTGGAGAVGAAAVQLLRWAGAYVIATASTAQKADAARAAGAHEVIRYREEPVAQRLAQLAPDGLDRVVDVSLASNLPTYADVLAPGAVVVAYAGGSTTPSIPMRAFMRRNATLRFVHVYGTPEVRLRPAIEDVTAALAEGVLVPVATQVLQLERIAEAHQAVEAGPFGRVLLELPAAAPVPR
jgi:NADPH2:quinone reductase